MTPKQFENRFIKALPIAPQGLEDSIGTFVVFGKDKLGQVGLHPEDLEFLSTVGLPQNSPPGLHFSQTTEFDTFSYGIPNAENYFLIGGNAYGDGLFIDKSSREIIYFNHDNDNERGFINSNLLLFAECLCLFVEHFFARNMEPLIDNIRSVDRRVKRNYGFWASEIQITRRGVL